MESVLIVTNCSDGKRYRLVIKGALSKITGAKVKKYMTSHVGPHAPSMVLTFQGREITDGTPVSHCGVQSGDTLALQHHDHSPGRASARLNDASSVAASLQQVQLAEAESLDEQREQFIQDVQRRQYEFQKTVEDLDLETSERLANEARLENELRMKQEEMRRLAEEKEAAAAERRRLEDLRIMELEKERQRKKDLEERQRVLEMERERHRELELQKIELERKQQLLQQQKMEAEVERERVERERREYEARIAAQEAEVRERESRLEREKLEYARRMRELERDRAQLQQQKALEEHRFSRERELDEMRLREIQNAAAGIQHEIQYDTQRSDPKSPLPPPSDPLPPHRDPIPALPPQRDLTPQHPPWGVSPGRISVAPSSAASPAAPMLSSAPPVDCTAVAAANLEEFAKSLGQPLQFDSSHTCVVDVDDKHTIMISYDKETERLYIYSSLLCNVPKDPTVRLQLYESLLEGALLGRDMAGGGVGLSTKDDFILMCTSISLHAAQPHSLKVTVPVFLESLRRWRRKVRELLTGHIRDDATNSESWRSPSVDQHETYAVIGVELTEGVDGPMNKGVIVVRVKGPAAMAGIRENDVIKYVNGTRVTTLRGFQDVTSTLVPEVPASFIVERHGEDISIEVRPGRGKRLPGEQRRYRVSEEALRRSAPTPTQRPYGYP